VRASALSVGRYSTYLSFWRFVESYYIVSLLSARIISSSFRHSYWTWIASSLAAPSYSCGS